MIGSDTARYRTIGNFCTASGASQLLEAQLAAAQCVMLQLVAGELVASRQIKAQLIAVHPVAGTIGSVEDRI
jgi:hypothetical protein